MTPQEIAQAAESVSMTPWYISAWAAVKYNSALVGVEAGFAWFMLQPPNCTGLNIGVMSSRGVLERLDWHADPWELNRTEIATVILEKVFGDTDDSL